MAEQTGDMQIQFLALPTEEKRKVLSQRNSAFVQLPPEEQDKVLQSLENRKLAVANTISAEDTEADKNIDPVTGENIKPLDQIISDFVFSRQGLEVAKKTSEGLALIGGGVVGGATPAGPFGAVAGSGLALSGVRSFFNGIEEMLGIKKQPTPLGKAKEVAEDFAEGAVSEAGGQILGPIVKGTINRIPKAVRSPIKTARDKLALTDEGAQVKASQRFQVEAQGTAITQPQITKNIRLAKSLEGRIPGLKFTQGQITNDASAIALERTLARKSGQDLSQSQREFANKILSDFYKSKVIGSGQISDFTGQVSALNEKLKLGTSQAEDAVNAEVLRLSRHIDPQSMGKNILNKLSKASEPLKKQINNAYSKIPNLKINTNPLLNKINELKAEFVAGEPASDIPSKALRIIERNLFKKTVKKQSIDAITGRTSVSGGGLEPRPVSLETMRKINRSINGMIDEALSPLKPNKVLARRLQLLKDGINESFDITADTGGQKGIDLLKKANALRTELGQRFEKGTIADVLQRGKRGEDTRIALANIAEKFNSLDGIDDLVRALGDKDISRQAMKDFYIFDLLNHAKGPDGNLVTRKLQQWLAKNSLKLKKLGLLDDFKNTQKLQLDLDSAKNFQDVFNKSVAGKVLDSNTETMVANAFRGSKNFSRTAKELMDLTNGNKSAERGLQKAVSEHLIRQSENTTLDFFQQGGETVADAEFVKSVAKMTNQIKKFAPAIRVIFKNDPEKVKALNDVWKSYQTLSRTARSPVAGGSDTFELFGRTIDIVAGSTAPGQWYAFKTIRDILNRFGAENTERYLLKAMFDPDYAQSLIAMTQGPTPSKATQINRLMTVIVNEFQQSEDQQSPQ